MGGRGSVSCGRSGGGAVKHASAARAPTTRQALPTASNAAAKTLPRARPVPEPMSEQVEPSGGHRATRRCRGNRVPASVGVFPADGESKKIGQQWQLVAKVAEI